MAIGYLTLSSNTAGALSTWTGIMYPDGIGYTTPTTDSQTITVSVPAEMEGAVFNSATLSYSVSSGSGTRKVCYSGGAVNVTNANLLEKLQNGESLNMYFQFKASGGTGGAGSHSASCTWSNIAIAVDYTPASGVNNTVTVTDAGTAVYSIEKKSLAYGESCSLTVTARPALAVTKVTVEIRPGTLSAVATYSTDRSIAANGAASMAYTLSIPADMNTAMSSRINAAQIRITFTGANGTTYTSGWVSAVNSGDSQTFKLLKTRSAPAISAVTWGESGTSHLSAYGSLIAGKTIPTLSFTVTLDTDADSGIGYQSRVLVLDDKSYTLSANSGTLQPISESGTVSYTITVTDSYGQVGTLSGSVTALAYTPPTLSGVAISRYVASLNTQGQTIYELDDDGTSLWFDAEITVQTSLGSGTNKWSLKITPAGGTAINVLTNSSLATKTYNHDRTVLTATYANTSTFDFTIELSDAFTTVTYQVSVPKAGGIFNIETTGVAVGMRSTGTEENPLFEVAYESRFNAIVYDRNGNEISGTPDDTGWVSNGITLSNCSDYGSTRSVGVRRRNGTVFLRGGITLASALSSGAGTAGQVQIGTLAEDYRPEQVYDFAIVLAKTNGYLRMIVDSTGAVTLHNYSGYAIGTNIMIPINACWCASD